MALQLHVRSLAGHIASLPADTSWTALNVKQALETIVNVPATEVHLFKETLELRNTDVLGNFPESSGGAMDLSWVQATPWPCFALDEALVREAEEAATRFVSFGPWTNGYIEPQRTMIQPNGTGPLGPGAGAASPYGTGVPCSAPMSGQFGHPSGLAGLGGGEVAPDGTKVGAAGAVAGMVPAGYGGGPAGWGPAQVVPPDFGWGGAQTGTAPGAGASMLGGVPGNGLAPPVALGGMPPAGAPNMVAPTAVSSGNYVPHETWSQGMMTEETAKQAPTSPSAVAATPLASTAVTEQPPAPAATLDQPDEKPTPSTTTAVAEASTPSLNTNANLTEVATGSAAEVAATTSGGGEGSPPTLPEGATDVTQQPSLPSPTTPSSTAASPAAAASPSGGNSWQSDFVNPNRTWANIVTKEAKEAQEAKDAAGRQASSSSAAVAGRKDEDVRSRNSIIDYLLLLAKCKGETVNGELPEELKKFKQATESGVSTNGRAKYNRRGMKNDANNCYVNVVIQSLLPCSALMQLLSNCAADCDRPFYTGMLRLCKEFHSRKEVPEALNVLSLPQVKKIISTWQKLGAQQDAGEFLFHILNGMHEECKWKTLAEESSSTAEGGASAEVAGEDGEGGEAAQVRPDVRSSGEHEESPIFRIFGGIIRSTVLTRNAKADSVSLEPFNGLILDISSSSVDSVWSALEAYCGTEAVNEGRATKRLQFKAVPKVMILNLKRFSYNKDTGCPQKIRKTIKFEEKLTFDRNWLVDELEPQEYQLTAVICHHGELVSGGHYNAAVRYNSDWFMYDDVSVRQIDIREVVSQLAASVYLLLYQCNDRIDVRP